MKKSTNVETIPSIRKRNSNDASATCDGIEYQIIYACIIILLCLILGKKCMYTQISQEDLEDIAVFNDKEVIQLQLKYLSSPLPIEDFMKTFKRLINLKTKKNIMTCFIVHNKTGEAYNILDEQLKNYDFIKKFLLLKMNFGDKLKYKLRLNMKIEKLNKCYNKYKDKMKIPKFLTNEKSNKLFFDMFILTTGMSLNDAKKEIKNLLFKKYANFINENKKQKKIRINALYFKLRNIVSKAVSQRKTLSFEYIKKKLNKKIKEIRREIQIPLQEKDNEIKEKDNEIKEKVNEIKEKDNEIKKLKKQLAKIKK